MFELLTAIRALLEIEEDLRNAASFTSDDNRANEAVCDAWRRITKLREAMQAEVDRCEAAYAKELRCSARF